MTTPATPSVALSAARQAQQAPLLSVDLMYRKHDYRLAEPERGDGHARVTTVGMRSMPIECSRCRHEFRGGSRIVVVGTTIMHPGCAIKAGQLKHTPRCQEQDASDAALAKRDHAERMRALDAAREARS